VLTTLTSVFCLLAVVRALDGVHFFGAVAETIIALLRTRRSLVLGLVGITLVASMLITNDMALLTLLPLTVVTLRATGNDDLLTFVFVMETVAANLGGMITPFGSPQNLYLYQFYGLGLGDFLRIMVLPFAASVVLIVLACLRVGSTPHEPVVLPHRVVVGRTVLYLALFALTVAIVVRAVPAWAGLVVVLVLLVADRSALLKVDWLLLVVLAVFFAVAEGLSRVPSVASALGDVLAWDPLVVSALASQVLSNVPTAVLAAPFTGEHAQLLVGVNIGGVGTVVASLASLITLRQHAAERPGETRRFLRVFTVVNVGFLAVLLVVTRGAVAAGWA